MTTTVRNLALNLLLYYLSVYLTASDISSTLSYVDLVQINKSTCNMKTEEIYVIYPGNTACLSSSNSTKGFCYVSYLRSRKYSLLHVICILC